MYRIKNEERWIRKSLESASQICESIVILDDGSTDNTVKICKEFDIVKKIQTQKNESMDIVRDANKILKMAMNQNPDFLLRLDGDEIIQPKIRDSLEEEINLLYPESSIFEFQSFHLWDKPNQYRSDGMYPNLWHPILLRLKNQPNDLKFLPYSGSKLHPSLIPTNAIGWEKPIRSKVKIFHYGNYDEALRQRKYKFYTTNDPDNEIFDGYKHIISGKGKYSGPNGIEFRKIPDGQYIKDII
jgi:O-antigen biosynthesis protein